MVRNVVIAALFAVLACALPAAANDTVLLGGLVATDASDNEDSGLVDIGGIHSGVWDVELPWVTDLLVYLRWQGEGQHDLAIELVDGETSEVLSSLEDELDLEDFSTSFTTYELSNVIFERPGLYSVVVFLDDEYLFDIPYFVNAEEDEDDWEPHFLASIPAVDGWLDEDGYGAVEGAFEHFTFSRFPASDDFAIVTLWFSGNDSWSQRCEIRDPTGTVIARSEPQDLDAWPGEMTVLTDVFDNVLFRTAGDYEVAIFLDDEEVMSYLLRVVNSGQQPASITDAGAT